MLSNYILLQQAQQGNFLTKGDNVVTAGGIHGKIVDANDNENYFLLEIASGVRIRIDKGSVYPSAAEASQAAAEGEKK